MGRTQLPPSKPKTLDQKPVAPALDLVNKNLIGSRKRCVLQAGAQFNFDFVNKKRTGPTKRAKAATVAWKTSLVGI